MIYNKRLKKPEILFTKWQKTVVKMSCLGIKIIDEIGEFDLININRNEKNEFREAVEKFSGRQR